MDGARIFLKGPTQSELIPMVETAYAAEYLLQEALASYPELLPGDQINPEEPRRWLLVSREMGVPGDVGETGRWSLDHLFLDQDGIPTFVECKRAVDTRARREVVAQMLDYAANGLAYWSIDRLRQAAAETASAAGQSLDDSIRALLGAGDEETVVDGFWAQVEANLANGKVRLVFVADQTSKELRRLVEFLNDKLMDVEVLAVEIKQYQGLDHTALVPRVVGLTEAARSRKTAATASKAPTTREQFLAACEPEAARFFEHVLALGVQHGYTTYWGTKGFSLRAALPSSGNLASFVYGWPPGNFEVYFGQLHMEAEAALALRKRLLDFGVFRESGQKTLRASITPETIPQLKVAYDLILDEVGRMRQGDA